MKLDTKSPRLEEHLEKLRHFICVAETGCFSLAAKKLRMTQPTLSRSVKIIEEVLGTPVFLRTSRGVELTDMGEYLLAQGLRLLSQSEEIERAFREQKSGLPKTLTIGTKEPYAVHLFPAYLKQLDTNLPDTTIALSIKRTNSELLQDLLQGKVDAVVIPDPPSLERLVCYELAKDRFGLFAAPTLTKSSKSPRSQSDLLYVFRQALCAGSRRIEQVLQKMPKSKLRLKDLDSFEAALALAVNEMGLALLPYSITRTDVAAHRLVPVTRKDFPTERFGTLSICLCLHAKNSGRPAFRKFVHSFLSENSSLH